MDELNKLLALAESEVGYQEKKNNNALDDPDANAGKSIHNSENRGIDCI